jgi:phosphatidate phosphatase APP1
VSDQSVNDATISLTAELIAKQPAHLQETLLISMSDYLGRPDVLAMKDHEIMQRLRGEIQVMQKNPWAAHSNSLINQQQDQKNIPAVAGQAAWQSRLSAQNVAGSSLAV